MRLSVRAKQVAGVTSLVGLTVLALSALYLASLMRLTLVEYQARGDLLADTVFQRAHDLVAAGGDPRVSLAADKGVAAILASAVYSPSVMYAAITDDRGTVVAHGDPEAVGRPLPHQPALGPLLQSGVVAQWRAVWADAGVYEVRTPLLIDGRAFGTIRIGVSMLLVRQDLEAALRPAAYTALAALAVAALVALVLAHSLLRPVHLIRSGLSRLGRGEFGVVLDLPGRDEFGELGTFFNTLSAQVSADRSQLAGQKATLESLVERFEEAVGFFDARGELLFANPAMLALLPEDALGRTADRLFDEGHPFRRLVEDGLQGDEPPGPVAVRLRERGVTSTDDLQEERLATIHVIDGPDAPGGHAGVMLVARNLTRLSEVQSTINTSRRLAALGRLTAGVAHELKNPLNAMGIHLELIRQQIEPGANGGDGPDVAALAGHVDVLTGAIRRLDEAVQAFLKFTRPEELRLEPLLPAALLSAVQPIIEAEARARNIAVEMQCAPDVPAIRGDGAMLEQAFLNLALNACQAMPGGGRLRMAARAAAGRHVELVVEDTGVGIVPEHLDKVFNLYFTTKEGGSGIGLAMVYRTIQLHDGDIEVQSSPGAGTTFRVLLPQA